MLQGVRVKNIGGRGWQRWWQEHSAKLAPCLRAEIGRGRGTAYDADVADACLRLFGEKGYTVPV